MSKEQLQNHEPRTVFVKLIKEDTSEYVETTLNSEAKNPLQQYLFQARKVALERIENVGNEFIEVDKHKGHGRRKGSREITDERKQKREQLRSELGRLVSALQGDLDVPIEVVMKEGGFKILGLEDISQAERGWWKWLKDEEFGLSDLDEIDPRALELLRARWIVNESMYTDEIERAKDKYYHLLSEVPDEAKSKLEPYIKRVMESSS